MKKRWPCATNGFTTKLRAVSNAIRFAAHLSDFGVERWLRVRDRVGDGSPGACWEARRLFVGQRLADLLVLAALVDGVLRRLLCRRANSLLSLRAHCVRCTRRSDTWRASSAHGWFARLLLPVDVQVAKRRRAQRVAVQVVLVVRETKLEESGLSRPDLLLIVRSLGAHRVRVQRSERHALRRRRGPGVHTDTAQCNKGGGQPMQSTTDFKTPTRTLVVLWTAVRESLRLQLASAAECAIACAASTVPESRPGAERHTQLETIAITKFREHWWT